MCAGQGALQEAGWFPWQESGAGCHCVVPICPTRSAPVPLGPLTDPPVPLPISSVFGAWAAHVEAGGRMEGSSLAAHLLLCFLQSLEGCRVAAGLWGWRQLVLPSGSMRDPEGLVSCCCWLLLPLGSRWELLDGDGKEGACARRVQKATATVLHL